MRRRRRLPPEVPSLLLLLVLLASPLLGLAEGKPDRCGCGMKASACSCQLASHRAGKRCSLSSGVCRCALRPSRSEGERPPDRGLDTFERPSRLPGTVPSPALERRGFLRPAGSPPPPDGNLSPETPPPRPALSVA